MAVFGAVIGRKIAEASPANALVGVQTNLAITNENLLQLAQCIESQNNLFRKEREKHSTSNFIEAVWTLSSSANDRRADFRKFASLPASETQHSRTANAVVDGIMQLNQKLNAINSTNSSNSENPPAPLVSNFERQEFNRLLDSAFDNVSEPPKLKTLEDRKRQRTKIKPKENAPSSIASSSTDEKPKESGINKEKRKAQKEKTTKTEKENKENEQKKEKKKSKSSSDVDALVVKRGRVVVDWGHY